MAIEVHFEIVDPRKEQLIHVPKSLTEDCMRCNGTGNNNNYDSTDDAECGRCWGRGKILTETTECMEYVNKNFPL